MPKPRRIYGAHFTATYKNRAKARRGAHHFKTGKYKKQWDRTEANRLKRQEKRRKPLFSIYNTSKLCIIVITNLINERITWTETKLISFGKRK